MAEPSLSLKLDDLQGEVGLFLGFGRGAANGDQAWTTQQTAAIESCVRSGLRNFYFPSPVEGMAEPYDWSFLKPVASLGLASGGSTIQLPDDFGGFEGELSISTTSAQVTWPVSIVGEGLVRQRHAELPESTGRPQFAAVMPLKGTTGTQGQRFQLYVWPLADQAYTLRGAYYLTPDALTGAFPYHLGGMAHAETVLESCLAIAEQRLDDASGVHSAKFQERLLASINLDRRLKPQTLGLNLDRSDGTAHSGLARHWLNPVTVGGVQY